MRVKRIRVGTSRLLTLTKKSFNCVGCTKKLEDKLANYACDGKMSNYDRSMKGHECLDFKISAILAFHLECHARCVQGAAA